MTDPTPEVEAAPAKPRRRRLKKWLWIALAVAIVFRIVLGVGARYAVGAAASAYGLEADWEQMDLALLGGSIEIRHLELRDEGAGEGAQPPVHLEFVELDVDTLPLLWLTLRVHRVELDGADLVLEKDAAGFPLIRRFTEGGAEPAPEEPEAEDEPAPWSLAAPITLAALRAQHVQVRIVDTVEKSELGFEANVRVSDLGHPKRKTRVELQLTGRELFHVVTCRMQLSPSESELDFEGFAEVGGLSLQELEKRFGLRRAAAAAAVDGGVRFRGALRCLGEKRDRLGGKVECSANLSGDGSVDANLSKVEIELRDLTRDGTCGLEAKVGPSAVTLRVGPGGYSLAGVDIGGIGGDDRKDLELRLPGAALTGLAIGSDQPAEFSVQIASPEVVERAELSGTLRLANKTTLDAKLTAEGVTLDRLAPFLRRAGLEDRLQNGRLGLAVHADLEQTPTGMRAEARLTDLVWRDRESLFELARAEIGGVEVGAKKTRVESLRLAGLRTFVRRDEKGAFELLGLATSAQPGRVSTAKPTAEAPSVTPSPAEQGAPTAFELASLVIEDCAIEWRDESLQPAQSLRIDKLVGTGKDIVLDPNGTSRGRVELVVSAAEVCERFGIDVQLAGEGGVLAPQLSLAASKLDLRPLAPWLEPLGIEPVLSDGTLEAKLAAKLADDGASCELTGIALRDGERELAGIDAIRVESLPTKPRAALGPIVIERPRILAERDADGALLACGIRIPPPPSEKEGEPATPSEPKKSGAENAPAPPQPPKRGDPLVLGGVQVRGLELRWNDRSVSPPVATAIRGEVELGAGALPGSKPIEWTTAIVVDGVLDQLSLAGTLRLDDGLAATLALNAKGIRAGPLAAYLPPTLESSFESATFALEADVAVKPAKDGGNSIRATVGNLSLVDRDRTWLGLEELAIAVPRIDPDAGVLDIGAITTKGLGVRIERDAKGPVDLLGLMTKEAVVSEPVAAAASKPNDKPIASQPFPWKRIRIGKLDVGVQRLEVVEAGAKEPLVAALAVRTPDDLVVLDASPDKLPPVVISIEGQVAPLVDRLRARVEVAPWVDEPKLAVSLKVSGIQGARLADAMPSMVEQLDAGAFVDGSLECELETLLRIRRREPTRFDFADGFGLSAKLGRFALRTTPDAEVAVGLDGIDLEVKRILPASGLVHIDSIDVRTPRLRVSRDKDGLQIAGLRFPAPAEPETETQPTDAPEKGDPGDSVVASPPTAAPDAAKATGEVRIDSLTVEGIAVDFSDTSVDPACVVPLRDLEVSVQRFTTKTLEEARPFRFAMSLRGGEIDLPERQAGSLLGGVLGAVAGVVSGKEDEYKSEKRRLFDEIELQGRLALGPQPQGRIRLGVAALELPAFRGLTQSSGVTIGDGVFDLGVRVELDGKGQTRIRSTSTFGYLSLDEPANGPISSYLKLPAPLDTVLFVLRNEDGEHVIPVGVTLQDGQIGGGAIAAAAAEVLLSVVTKAIAASPFRIVGGIVDMAGLGGEEEKKDSDGPKLALGFDAGVTTVRPDELDKLAPLIEELADDETVRLILRHELSRADVAKAELLASPATPDARALADRLRNERNALRRRAQEAKARARVQWGLGNEKRAKAASAELRKIERSIGLKEAALDDVFALLGPSADRRRPARTKRAATRIGQRRLEAVYAAILRDQDPELATRVEIKRAKLAVGEGEKGRVLLFFRRLVE